VSGKGHDGCRIMLLKSVLEACMVHVVNCGAKTVKKLNDDSMSSVVHLYQHYAVLPSLMDAVTSVSEGKSSSSSSSSSSSAKSKSKKDGKRVEGEEPDDDGSTRKTCFSLQAIVCLLGSLTNDGRNEEEEDAPVEVFGDESYHKNKNSLRRMLLHLATSELGYVSHQMWVLVVVM
jgi:hypothetical protein